MSASKETGSLPVSRTASPAPSEEDRVGPPSSTGKAHWTGLFRQAVSSMEQHIDRVLDTPTSRPSSATSVPDRSSPAPIEPAESSDTRLARRLEATVRQSLNRRIPDDNVSDTASKSQQPQQRSSSASSNSVKLESDTEQNETEKNDITTDETAASDDMESQMENTSSTMEDEEKESATLNNDIEVTTITDTEHKSSSETAQDDKETKQSLDSISRQHSDTVDDDTIVTTNDQSPATTSNDDHINDTNDEENIWLRDRIRALESQIESQKLRNVYYLSNVSLMSKHNNWHRRMSKLQDC
ncbi:hypothetical protein BDF22DRAFT_449193 [Syncephalis plumigaleata]|nr:hypothetical protein BDF22DRAFT_449193 [Syncephalis plumigaleata]